MSWLSLFIAIPFATALAVVATPDSRWYARRWIALTGTGVVLALSLVLTVGYMQAVSERDDQRVEDQSPVTISQMEFEQSVPWFKSMGIDYHVGVDGISMAMIVLTSIIIFTGVLASWDVKDRSREFYAFLLVLVTGVFGVFISIDLFLFFVFYELAVLPMYLLIGIWGTGRKEYAAMKLTLMLMVGSAFVLVGILALHHAAGSQTFDLNKLAAVEYSAELQYWVFPCVFVGFGVLGALFPFHTWSPDGHASAPTAVSMLHAGVLMKLGGYGVLRVAIYLMPQGAQQWAAFFLVLTTINIVYGAFAAIRQTDLKYFTAYSSVSHCGFVLFGICSLNMMGFKGAVIQMFSHGIMTGLFFGLIGMVYGRSKTRDMTQMGGLAKRIPWLASCFYIAGLASLGLPGLSGFVAESTVFLGGFFGNAWVDTTMMRICTLLATSSIVVTAVYVLRGLARVFQGEITKPEFNQLTDATLPEKLCTGILVATLAIVGMYPPVLIDLIEHAILPIANRF